MFYFNSVKTIGVSLSTVLVYTSPLFIALFSRIIYKEKIDKIEEKINQLNAQKQALLAREKEKERKARTRRLIQIVAIIENMEIDNVELANKFKSYFNNN